MKHLKTEFQIIYNLVQKGDTVLDLGCGNGELISHLQKHKKTFCYGVEREVSLIISCLKKKLNVVQIDLDKTSLLKHFQAKSFDTALMTQALQSVRRPDILLEEMLQLANHAIVTFPNFGNWKMRFQLLLKGKMPESKTLPYHWYDTPNIHLCTFKDFENLCLNKGIKIKNRSVINETLITRIFGGIFPNLFGEVAIYQIVRNNKKD